MNVVKKKYLVYLISDCLIISTLLIIASYAQVIIVSPVVTCFFWLIISIIIWCNGCHAGFFKAIKPFVNNYEMLEIVAKETFNKLSLQGDQQRIENIYLSEHFIFIDNKLLPIYMIDGYWIKNQHVYLTFKNGSDIHLRHKLEPSLVNQVVKLLQNKYHLTLTKYDQLQNIIRDKTNQFYAQYTNKQQFLALVLNHQNHFDKN